MLIRFPLRYALLPLGVALVSALLFDARVSAQDWQGNEGQPNGGSPVYQQNAFDGGWRDKRRDRRDFRRDSRFVSPQVSSSWFQRPYPYHLDYYKMRYGGSYAPYFGNLYGTPFGTPQVVNYPPYYGPYFGGNGGGNGNGYGQPGFGGNPMEFPANPGAVMPGTVVEQSGATEAVTKDPAAKSGGEALPTP